MLSQIMRIVSALLSVYMILIIIRIFLTWFRGNMESKVIKTLISVVDPYLNIFRRITWLKVGAMDFSPIIAVMILGLLTQISTTMAQNGRFTAIMLVTYIIYSIWSFVSFILDILVIMMVVRLISTFITSKSHQIWFIVDNILNKVMAKILGIFTTKPIAFKKALIINGLIILGTRLLLGFSINFIINLLNGL